MYNEPCRASERKGEYKSGVCVYECLRCVTRTCPYVCVCVCVLYEFIILFSCACCLLVVVVVVDCNILYVCT